MTWAIKTVGDLREATAVCDDAARIEWEVIDLDDDGLSTGDAVVLDSRKFEVSLLVDVRPIRSVVLTDELEGGEHHGR